MRGRVQSRLVFAVLVACCLVFPGTRLFADDVSFDDAMRASAIDLAEGLLFVTDMLENTLPMAEMGVTVHLLDETITEDNAQDYRAEYERRRAIYARAIEERGFARIEGRYDPVVTESCARAGTSWAGLILEGEYDAVRFEQDGMHITFVIDFTFEEEPLQARMTGVTLEDRLIFVDAFNSEYYVTGTIGETIELRPDARVLLGWPDWAGPPDRADIENCQVRLTRNAVQP